MQNFSCPHPLAICLQMPYLFHQGLEDRRQKIMNTWLLSTCNHCAHMSYCFVWIWTNQKNWILAFVLPLTVNLVLLLNFSESHFSHLIKWLEYVISKHTFWILCIILISQPSFWRHFSLLPAWLPNEWKISPVADRINTSENWVFQNFSWGKWEAVFSKSKM